MAANLSSAADPVEDLLGTGWAADDAFACARPAPALLVPRPRLPGCLVVGRDGADNQRNHARGIVQGASPAIGRNLDIGAAVIRFGGSDSWPRGGRQAPPSGPFSSLTTTSQPSRAVAPASRPWSRSSSTHRLSAVLLRADEVIESKSTRLTREHAHDIAPPCPARV